MKKKLTITISAVLVVLTTLILFASSAMAAVNVGTRTTTHYLQYNGGSGWNDLKTPEHYIVGTSPEQIAYCLQHRNDSPHNASYNETDILGSYSTRVQTGLRIILENGYPYATGGLTATKARYATANAVRFWLSENGDSGQYNFTNLGSYSDAQLRSAAASGTIGNSTTTPRDLTCDEDIKIIFYVLSESVCARMREHGFLARTVVISIRDNELFRFERQTKLGRSSCISGEIAAAAMQLFHQHYSWPKPIRSIGVRCTDLLPSDMPLQLSLFEDESCAAQVQWRFRALLRRSLRPA